MKAVGFDAITRKVLVNCWLAAGMAFLVASLAMLATEDDSLRYFLVTAAAFCAGLMLLVSRMVSRTLGTIIRSVGELIQVTRQVCRSRDYSVRVAAQPHDAFNQLAEELNELLAQIQAQESLQERHRLQLAGQLADCAAALAVAEGDLADEKAERRLAREQLLHATEEFRQINDEMRNFTYIVSHDLRAPLVNIKGFASELRTCLGELERLIAPCRSMLGGGGQQAIDVILQQDVTEALHFIESSVTRMDGLIGAILRLSRIGRRELRAEPVDLAVLVWGILQSLQHQLESRRVTIDIGELPVIIIDRTAIEQVFGNLLDNAVKYLDPERPGTLAISSKMQADELVFRVADNGRGIAADDCGKIFDIFRRAGAQDIPGEGMGLTYVKTLIRRLGGRIWVESELGVGSTFCFTLSSETNPMIDNDREAAALRLRSTEPVFLETP